MPGGPLIDEKTHSEEPGVVRCYSRWLGVCSLESDCLGSHPSPAISWLCDTEQVAPPFCAFVFPCMRWRYH